MTYTLRQFARLMARKAVGTATPKPVCTVQPSIAGTELRAGVPVAVNLGTWLNATGYTWDIRAGAGVVLAGPFDSATPSVSYTPSTGVVGQNIRARVLGYNGSGTADVAGLSPLVGPVLPAHAAPGPVEYIDVFGITPTGAVSLIGPPLTGDTPTDYLYSLSDNGGSFVAFTDPVSADITRSITGLTAGHTYILRVAAVAGDLQGPSLDSDPFITDSDVVTAPGIPGAITVSAITQTGAGLAWSAPSTGYAPTDYRIQYRRSADTAWTTLADGVSTAVTASLAGLTAGTSYDVRVRGSNAGGVGPWRTMANAFTTDAAVVTGISHGVNVAAGEYYLLGEIIANNAAVFQVPSNDPVMTVDGTISGLAPGHSVIVFLFTDVKPTAGGMRETDYVLKHTGPLNITMSADANFSNRTNGAKRITFHWTGLPASGYVHVTLTNPAGGSTYTGPTGLVLVAADEEGNHAAGKVLMSSAATRLAKQHVIRWMGAQRTNDGNANTDIPQQSINDIPGVDMPIYGRQKQKGFGPEFIALAHKQIDAIAGRKVRAHVCMPYQFTPADSAAWAARAYAVYPGMLLDVEYSNEVWNPGTFKHFAWVGANRSDGLVIRDSLGVVLTSPDALQKARCAYGSESAKTWAAFETVFPRAQIRRVIGAQASWPDLMMPSCQYVVPSTGERVGDMADVYSIAAYLTMKAATEARLIAAGLDPDQSTAAQIKRKDWLGGSAYYDQVFSVALESCKEWVQTTRNELTTYGFTNLLNNLHFYEFGYEQHEIVSPVGSGTSVEASVNLTTNRLVATSRAFTQWFDGGDEIMFGQSGGGFPVPINGWDAGKATGYTGVIVPGTSGMEMEVYKPNGTRHTLTAVAANVGVNSATRWRDHCNAIFNDYIGGAPGAAMAQTYINAMKTKGLKTLNWFCDISGYDYSTKESLGIQNLRWGAKLSNDGPDTPLSLLLDSLND